MNERNEIEEMIAKIKLGGSKNLEEVEDWLIGKEQYLPKLSSAIDWLLFEEYALNNSKKFLAYCRRYFLEKAADLGVKERAAVDAIYSHIASRRSDLDVGLVKAVLNFLIPALSI